MPGALEILIRDAAETVGRMRSDARHLRTLGQRAKVGAAVAHARFRASVDRVLERVADGMLDVERKVKGSR